MEPKSLSSTLGPYPVLACLFGKFNLQCTFRRIDFRSGPVLIFGSDAAKFNSLSTSSVEAEIRLAFSGTVKAAAKQVCAGFEFGYRMSRIPDSRS